MSNIEFARWYIRHYRDTSATGTTQGRELWLAAEKDARARHDAPAARRVPPPPPPPPAAWTGAPAAAAAAVVRRVAHVATTAVGTAAAVAAAAAAPVVRAPHPHAPPPRAPGHRPVIRFYNRGDPYYEFTNFYPSPVHIDGRVYPTTEHYFQAQKFVKRPELVEHIRTLPTAREAFEAARKFGADVPKVGTSSGSRLPPLHGLHVCRMRAHHYPHAHAQNWHSIKDGVMLTAVRAKFAQHEKLRRLLLDTGNAVLVEHTANDNYWGDGGDGRGKNQLGQTLMHVREELRQSQR